jgi:CcmD family protein
MKKFSRILIIGLMLLSNLSAFSQSEGVEMADSFRADGKIYVVVAIILVVLLGLVGYLFLLDRKLTKIEKQLGSKNPR